MQSKKYITYILVLSILLSMFFTPVSAYADELEIKELTICSDGEEAVYDVIVSGGIYYLKADEYSAITRYGYSDNGPNYIVYNLGIKTVEFEKTGRNLYVSVDCTSFEPATRRPLLMSNNNSYKTEYSGALNYEGEIYLPIAEVLPWLSVNVSVEGDVLYIATDPYTYWELCYKFVNEFSLADEFGTDFASSAAQVALNTLDTIFNFRFEKLVWLPVETESSFPAFANLYSYNSYMECLIEMSSDESLVSETGKEILSGIKNVGKVFDGIESMFPEDTLDYILYLNAHDMELFNAWSDLADAFQAVQDAGTVAGVFGDIANGAKSIELIMRAVPEYLDTLEYIKENVHTREDAVLRLAAESAYDSLDSVMATVLKDLFLAGVDGLKEIGTESLETILGGLVGAFGFVKAALSLVWPALLDGAKESALLPIYGNIMNLARSEATSLIQSEMDMDAVYNSRLMLILAYKASIKNYEAMESILMMGEGMEDIITFIPELLEGEISFSGDRTAEEWLSYEIAPIQEELVKLAFAGTCVENDSIEGKEEYTADLENMLEALLSSGESVFSDALDNDSEYRLIGVSEYYAGDLMRTSTIEYNSDGLISCISVLHQYGEMGEFVNNISFEYNEKGLMTTCEQINDMLCSVWDYYYEDDCLVEESVYHDNGAYATTYYEYDNSGNLLRETTDEYEVYADTMIYSEVSYTNKNGRVVSAELTSSAYVDEATEFSYYDANPVVIKEGHYAAGLGGGTWYHVLLPNGRNLDYEMPISGDGISPFEPDFDDRGLLVSADLGGDCYVEFEYEKIGGKVAPISSLPDSEYSYIIWLYEDKIYDVDGLACAEVDVIESDVYEASENELIVFSPDAEIWPWVGDDFLSHPSEYFADDNMATGGAYMIVDILDGYVISMSPFYDTWVFRME